MLGNNNNDELNRELASLLGDTNPQVAKQTEKSIEHQIKLHQPPKSKVPAQPEVISEEVPMPAQSSEGSIDSQPEPLFDTKSTGRQQLPFGPFSKDVESMSDEPHDVGGEERAQKEIADATTTPDNSLRISHSHWHQYHIAWQNYYKRYYADLARKQVEPKAHFEQQMKQEIQQLAATKPKNYWKLPFSRKFLPFTLGILTILIICFLQYNRNIIGFFADFVAPNHGDLALVELPGVNIGSNISAEPTLYIPKLNVTAPLILGAANDEKSQNKAMENGVAQFSIPGANAMPGQVGNLAIAGHSSNDLFTPGKYKFIFARLEQLSQGDTIYLDYGGTRYVYKITRTEEVQPTESNKLALRTDRPMLTLITCTPVGTALRRLLVFAEQVAPTPPTSSTPTIPDSTTDIEMPANAPTLLDRIRALFH
ncbi:MAG: sortase [Candidatus Nomurabacteria bacterium]|jgi:sortase A|nr:sortase [Candidatus Nomurabacteria bacterium]